MLGQHKEVVDNQLVYMYIKLRCAHTSELDGML